tara:strand:+ start:22 stop:366 length:345 start_codon:yes stop_codon:yes gene_type:complete
MDDFEIDENDFEDSEQIIIKSNDEDCLEFMKNYQRNKRNNKTSPNLTKYERTRILSERAQQISDGSKPLIPNPERYTQCYDIALEELNKGKLPFIIRRPYANGFEYWKIDDLII